MAIAATRVDLRAEAAALFRRKRMISIGMPLLVLTYFVYIFVSFDIAGIAERARPDNARILLSDTYSFKTHVTRNNRSGDFTVAIEGESKGTYAPGVAPDWVSLNGDDADVRLDDGSVVRFRGDTVVVDLPDFGSIELRSGGGDIEMSLPTHEVPDWISASATRVSLTLPAGRVQRAAARGFRKRQTVAAALGRARLASERGTSPLRGVSSVSAGDRNSGSTPAC